MPTMCGVRISCPMKGSTGDGNEWQARSRDVDISVSGLDGVKTSPFLYRIDDNTTNPYFVWSEEQGEPQYLSESQLADLHAASETTAEPLVRSFGRGEQLEGEGERGADPTSGRTPPYLPNF